jgi:hypothetical protein
MPKFALSEVVELIRKTAIKKISDHKRERFLKSLASEIFSALRNNGFDAV